MDDLISRQAAIDALGGEPLPYTEYEQGLHDKWIDAKENIEALPSVQPEQAIKDCRNCKHGKYNDYHDMYFCYNAEDCSNWDKWETSAQPEPKEIGYTECAYAMQKMWIDNVLTDGEYNHIMDKLNKQWLEGRRTDE